jgi:hypothetical protein
MNTSLVKGAIGLVVSSGTATIVGNLVKQSLPDDLSKIKKVTTAVAGFAIAGMAGAAAAQYAEDQIDAAASGLETGWLLAQELRKKKVVVVDVDPADVKDEPVTDEEK